MFVNNHEEHLQCSSGNEEDLKHLQTQTPGFMKEADPLVRSAETCPSSASDASLRGQRSPVIISFHSHGCTEHFAGCTHPADWTYCARFPFHDGWV